MAAYGGFFKGMAIPYREDWDIPNMAVTPADAEKLLYILLLVLRLMAKLQPAKARLDAIFPGSSTVSYPSWARFWVAKERENSGIR